MDAVLWIGDWAELTSAPAEPFQPADVKAEHGLQALHWGMGPPGFQG